MRWFSLACAAGATLVLVIACGGSDDSRVPPTPSGTNTSSSSGTGSPDNTGQSCSSPTQCYPLVDAGSLEGEVQCLSRVPGGYCTHLCETDADCCAVPGECQSGFKQVCSPFESTGQKMCFLSCEAVDIQAAPDAGTLDEGAYCATFAASSFTCRSSGGGKENRKVCVPEG